ncbi:hypothetical protein SPRG_21849 [Saprolegnia parasitica CBS 223.65]|uniref:Cytosol aminopeptidase domain-containing protein n=1 Tax=Saprolegnia parasitica (strain CBS 223.65) TaxID=695850 RepID=A0A067BHH7_SAPPC|nr:hypothetical protein SPRG_21849 [Saprolegnia parasitica CBS 223.65]KDO17633.1 hypothetical protein SPRG_21849 [Saprolegnia parasitica CBS 223.65]|eukprot:XP_012211660.1 hypothetical protein SPRG_21849 [Saprolegnia parasitica CBS 223.65]
MVRYLANVGRVARATALPKVVLIGTKETNGLDLGSKILAQLKREHRPLDPLARRLLAHTIDELRPTADAPVSAHVYLPLGDDDGIVSCTVATLPTAISRHNAFARPHAIASVVKAHLADAGRTLVGGHMAGMKADMGGAAGLLGAFDAAVRSGNVRARPLHCVLCIAENAIGPNATRPDEVHTFYSGKTVEVNDTDAEGRLVLADGVAYAVQHLNPALLLDMATLTGAQGVATGSHMGALYTNTDDLEAMAVAAGKASGDLVHPVPYVPEFYRPEYKSHVADMKNYMSNPRNAGVSCGGQFLANHMADFVDGDGQWMHIDMASPVEHSDKRATGYGVGFVQSLLEQLHRKTL